MSLHRFFLTAPLVSDDLPLSAADLHHLRDVLRLCAGDEIVLAEPGGRQLRVRLTSLSPEAATAEQLGELPASREPRVVLFQGLPKGPKTDEIVQRAVEVGVEAIQPVVCERTVVRLEGAKAEDRATRWRRIAAEAAKQSQRSFVPRVATPQPLHDAEGDLRSVDVLLVAWEESDGAPGIGEALDSAEVTSESRVGLVVGPEGGLTAEEVAWLASLGGVTVSLGDTILRTETAGVVGAALVAYELGGLGGAPRG